MKDTMSDETTPEHIWTLGDSDISDEDIERIREEMEEMKTPYQDTKGIRLLPFLYCYLTSHTCDPDGYVDTEEKVAFHPCRRCGAIVGEPYEIRGMVHE